MGSMGRIREALEEPAVTLPPWIGWSIRESQEQDDAKQPGKRQVKWTSASKTGPG